MKPFLFITSLFLLALVHHLPAVVVAGAKGGSDNSNNTTRAQLEQLPGVSNGFFFDNVVRYRGGNAVYIGYRDTGSGKIGYALSGIHLGQAATPTISIQNITYDIDDIIAVNGSDLALIVFSHSNNTMPNLFPIELSSTALSNNTEVIMIGEGRSRVQSATTDENTSDAVFVNDGAGYTTVSTREKRWGTNTTSNFESDPQNPTQIFNIGGPTIVGRTVFDEPSPGEWLTTNQAQAVTNDSGGGIFGYNGSLIGIMVAVQASTPSQAAFGNTTLFADIASYKSAIDDETGGALIPEPRSYGALAGMLFLVAAFARRRKHR